MNYALSATDIRQAINTNIFHYFELQSIEDIDKLFRNDSFVILYPIESLLRGHWVVVIRNQYGVEFFDPLGIFPDKQKDYALYSNLVDTINYLSRLLKNSKYNLSYNEHKFQRRNDEVTTCGRWVIVRCLMRDKSLEYFNQYIRKMMKKYRIDGDKLVVKITKAIIKK